MEPTTFSLTLSPSGEAAPGLGILAAFVPAVDTYPAVGVISGDPRNDLGRPLETMIAPILGFLRNQLVDYPPPVHWVVLDAWGRFFEAVSDASGTPELKRLSGGLGLEAFSKAFGPGADTAMEMLSLVVEGQYMIDESATAQDFLDAVASHGNLPSPGALFHKIDLAATKGDVNEACTALKTDPVILSSILSYANTAAHGPRKTANAAEAVQRLGMAQVRRIVFIAEMMARYRQGACPDFDYRAYWHNAIATGAAMRGLLERYEIPERLGDDAFAIGLFSSIGWLVLAETSPSLVSRYLERAREADPVTKARLQQELIPCPVRQISATYLARYAFPDTISAAIVGNSAQGSWAWFDCLASATRIGQALVNFDCLSIPNTLPVPKPCREEWQRWKQFLGSTG